MNYDTTLLRHGRSPASAPFAALLLLVAVFLLPATFATAGMVVTPGLIVKNDTDKNIIIAVHYMDPRGNWVTTSFNNIPARQQRNLPVSSKNSIFYYYAESTNGKSEWSGEHNFEVAGKLYPMKKATLGKKNDSFYLRLWLNP